MTELQGILNELKEDVISQTSIEMIEATFLECVATKTTSRAGLSARIAYIDNLIEKLIAIKQDFIREQVSKTTVEVKE